MSRKRPGDAKTSTVTPIVADNTISFYLWHLAERRGFSFEQF